MHVIRTIAEVRSYVEKERQRGRSIGFVPTMGAFHAGHASLMKAARAECDNVIVSVFVNPIQFADAAEYETYPRDENRDIDVAYMQEVDAVFMPNSKEIYPPMFATTVKMGGPLVRTLERIGLSKDGQLDGMCTIITKLFNIVQPDLVFFGEKDIPHWVAIEHMVHDLNLPAQVKVLPTVREPDGLAMSSRNVHLGAYRPQATALYRGLTAAVDALHHGKSSCAAMRQHAFAAMAAEIRSGDVSVEYLEVLDRETLEPVTVVEHPVLLCVGARVGPVTLLDILRADAPTSAPIHQTPARRAVDKANRVSQLIS